MVRFNLEGYHEAKAWLMTHNKWHKFLTTDLTAEQYAMIYMANELMEIEMRTKRKPIGSTP